MCILASSRYQSQHEEMTLDSRVLDSMWNGKRWRIIYSFTLNTLNTFRARSLSFARFPIQTCSREIPSWFRGAALSSLAWRYTSPSPQRLLYASLYNTSLLCTTLLKCSSVISFDTSNSFYFRYMGSFSLPSKESHGPELWVVPRAAGTSELVSAPTSALTRYLTKTFPGPIIPNCPLSV